MLIHNADITGSLTINGTPFNTGSFSGSFKGTIEGVSATASYVEYTNVANKPTLVSGSSQITYSGLTGIPSGIVSGSSQVSFNGIVDKPTLVSGSSQISYPNLSNIPSGIVSGSSQVTYSGLTGIPSGIVSGSSQVSFNGIVDKPTLVSGSSQISFNGIVDKPTLVSGSSQITYSGLTGIPSGIVSGSAQIAGLGYATTSSNTFIGNQTITGSIFGSGSLTIDGCITATGQIVAQTINVQQVTSSIVYSCGSNVFGTSIGNTQQFTGSMFITGSGIRANVGNACFQGSVCANTISTTDGSNTSTLANNFLRSTTGNFYFDACTIGGNFNFRTSNASALDSTALFICGGNNRIGVNCTTPGFALDVNGTFNIRTSTGSEVRIINYGGSSAKIRGTQSTLAIEACGAFTVESGGATERLRINENGIACFACQVCAPAFVGNITGGTYVCGTTLSAASEYRLNGNSFSRIATLDTGGGFGGGYNFNWCNGSPIHDSTGALVGYGYANDGSFRFYTNCSAAAGTTAPERMRITPGGRVGIGADSPQSKAHISFQADFDGLRIENSVRGHNYLLTTAGSSAEFFSIYDIDNSQYLYQLSNTGGHGFLTGGSAKMAITGGGIACFACQVCAPTFVLANGNCITALRSTGGAVIGVLGFSSGSDTLNIKGGNSGGALSIRFEDTANPMGGFYNSNFGVGTLAAAYRIDAFCCSSATNTVTPVLRLAHVTSGTAASGLGAGISFFSQRPSGAVNLERAAIYGISGANPDDDGDLAFYTRTDTGAIGVSEKMRITSDGNIGIGTTNPAATLHLCTINTPSVVRVESACDQAGLRLIAGVPGTARASRIDFLNGATCVGRPQWTIINDYNQNGTNNLSFVNCDPTTRVATITQEGCVGIGTISPAATLSVVGKTNLGNQTSGFYVTPSTLHIANTTVSQISFEDYVITAAIAVANNTFAFGHQGSSPSYEFRHSNTFNGNYAATGTIFARFNPSTSYISSGRVGIGVTSPQSTLHINSGNDGNRAALIYSTGAQRFSMLGKWIQSYEGCAVNIPLFVACGINNTGIMVKINIYGSNAVSPMRYEDAGYAGIYYIGGSFQGSNASVTTICNLGGVGHTIGTLYWGNTSTNPILYYCQANNAYIGESLDVHVTIRDHANVFFCSEFISFG